MVGHNGEPARYDVDTGKPIYEAICDVPGCGHVCVIATYEGNGLVATQAWIDEWVGKGPQFCNEHATPSDPVSNPEPVPESITPAQLRIAARRMLGIDRARLEGTVAQIIASVPDEQARQDAQDKWDLASVIERTHPLVAVVGQVFGLTQDQVDQLFRVGATL